MISFPTMLLRLLVALILGAFIGWEREYHEHNAGIRTNALVCLGTALFTLISAYGFLGFTTYQHMQVDPTRIASYIVAGIGFLGGGTILHKSDSPTARGLTTAASIWVVAAIGMACGIGMLLEASAATLITLGILIGLHHVEKFLVPQHTKQTDEIILEITKTTETRVLAQIHDILDRNHIQLTKIHITNNDNQKKLTITVHKEDTENIMQAFSAIQEIAGVESARMSFHINDH